MKLTFVAVELRGSIIDADVHSMFSADVADLYRDVNDSDRAVKVMAECGLFQEKLTLYESDVKRIRAYVDMAETAFTFFGFVSPWPRLEH